MPSQLDGLRTGCWLCASPQWPIALWCCACCMCKQWLLCEFTQLWQAQNLHVHCQASAKSDTDPWCLERVFLTVYKKSHKRKLLCFLMAAFRFQSSSCICMTLPCGTSLACAVYALHQYPVHAFIQVFDVSMLINSRLNNVPIIIFPKCQYSQYICLYTPRRHQAPFLDAVMLDLSSCLWWMCRGAECCGMMCVFVIFSLHRLKRRNATSSRSTYSTSWQNKLKGAKSNKQWKQRTAHKTSLVTHILNRLIRSPAEAPICYDIRIYTMPRMGHNGAAFPACSPLKSTTIHEISN